jgi:hypothetical protein
VSTGSPTPAGPKWTGRAMVTDAILMSKAGQVHRASRHDGPTTRNMLVIRTNCNMLIVRSVPVRETQVIVHKLPLCMKCFPSGVWDTPRRSGAAA